MKVFIKISFIMVAIFVVSFNNAYAGNSKARDRDGWFLLGYFYTFSDSESMDGLQGPVTITIGGDLWRFIGLEVTLGGRWETQNYYSSSSIEGNNNSYEATNFLWSFDIKPYLMFQPKLGVDMISLRPYLGIGPSFHFTGINSTEEFRGSPNSYESSASSFDVGFSVKAGLRLQALKFLFVGVGAEYLYHKTKLNNRNYNFSGWT